MLNESKVILSPTDTVWGLGCSAFSPKAISKIYSIKERDDDKPFILLVESVTHLKKYIKKNSSENLKPLFIFIKGPSA